MRINRGQSPGARGQGPVASRQSPVAGYGTGFSLWTVSRRRCKRERGGALLTVLWMAAALAAIAISAGTSIRTETDHVSTAAEGLRAQYLASGSVDRAIQWMIWGGALRGPDGQPRWKPNTARLVLNYPSGDAVVEMIPESSKLSVNSAREEDILRVVMAVAGDAQLAQQITAGIVGRRSATAAPPELGLAPTFQPRNTSFEEIEELLFVPGVTPELFYGNFVADREGRLYPRGGLRDALSVWGSTSAFDVNSASPAVLEAIGLPPESVQQLVARRTAQPFANLGEVSKMGIRTQRLWVGGNSNWTLRATARLHRPDGAPSDVVRSSAAVIKYWVDQRYAQNPVHVMRVYEDAWSQFAIPPQPAIPGVPVQ